jgi:hypothetical protein
MWSLAILAAVGSLGWAMGYFATRKQSHLKASFWLMAAALALSIAATLE